MIGIVYANKIFDSKTSHSKAFQKNEFKRLIIIYRQIKNCMIVFLPKKTFLEKVNVWVIVHSVANTYIFWKKKLVWN